MLSVQNSLLTSHFSSSSPIMGSSHREVLGNSNTTSKFKKHKAAFVDQDVLLPLTSVISSLPPSPAMTRQWNWWLKVIIHSLLVIAGQTAATLLNRFYYNQGGSSTWLQTLTLSAGFPILYLPLILTVSTPLAHRPPVVKIAAIYTGIGLITTADSLMYSYGLLYLPVSTYSLVCATQLAFNAIFSYFINSEQFTHLTLNSLVLLTFSATIIAVRSDSGDSSELSRSGGKYLLGFTLTIAASATYSFILSLMELTFDKVIKSRALSAVLKMQIYTALASTVAAMFGLFASGDWKGLNEDMENFKKGRVSYLMTFFWTSICWQVTNVGLVGLIFEVSSLFSNVISTLAMPIVPIFAVILFHEKMDGMKIISLLLATWGFLSYFYQHYLDYKMEKNARKNQRNTGEIQQRKQEMNNNNSGTESSEASNEAYISSA